MEKCRCGCGGFVSQKICQICEISFYPLHSSKGLFCSSRCSGLSRKGKNNPAWKGGKVKRTCVECGVEFEVFPAELRRDIKDIAMYCSKSCRAKAQYRVTVANGNHFFFTKEADLVRKRKRSEYEKSLQSKIMKGKYDGVKNPFYGQKHDEQTRKRMSIGRKKFFANGGTTWSKGKKAPQFAGRNNPMYGRKCAHPYLYRNSGKRDDIGMYFRSSWEANIARILNYLNIEWEYEKERFYFENLSYLPDFYLPRFDQYIEVKGRWGKHCKIKIELFKDRYGTNKIFVIDGPKYVKLKNQYGSIVPHWER